ncbi:hypothetical protein [Reichenbachiella sp.]|uniref:hypothetical protein n=1 Tax=Reichenbachiella sp. TaxID=2184521 RepID=UPI003BAE84D8
MPKPKNVIVTVTVDTDQITRENVTRTIVLSDDNGGTDQTPGDSCTFLSKINNEAQATFKCHAKNGTTPVTFISFNKTSSGPDIMNPMPEAPHWTTTVSGNQKDTENYQFTVMVDGKGEFTLDPEVEIKGP